MPWILVQNEGTPEEILPGRAVNRAVPKFRSRSLNRERCRLLKLGHRVGAALKDLITIVSYRTFTRWAAADSGDPAGRRKKSIRKPGRPRTVKEIRELVLQFAQENAWGYTRILGELKKLGVRSVSRTTVANILKAAGLDPGPKRGHGTWDEFIKRHASTLWACDFLCVRTATMAGMVDLFVLFFIHVGTRRTFVAGITASPNSEWVTQQARNASMQMDDWKLPAKNLLIDHDSKFTDSFDSVFEADGTEVMRVGPIAPNLNAYAERFAQTLRRECLDHFIVLGESHLRLIIKEFVSHYNEERPHQGKGNVPLPDADSASAVRRGVPCSGSRSSGTAR